MRRGTRHRIGVAAAAAWLTVGGPASADAGAVGTAADAAAEAAAHPCEHRSEYAALDFWVGDWDVQIGGQTVGRNTISKQMRGCLVVERWKGRGEGTSVNFFDPGDRRWHQHWVAENGTVVHYSGEVRDGVLHYEGVYVAADGTTTPARVTLGRRPDGVLHHRIEHSPDGGKTWEPYFAADYLPHRGDG